MVRKKKKREMVQQPLPPPVGPGQLHPMFVRLRPDVFALLKEAHAAVNASVGPGEAPIPLAAMVERCIMSTLSPGSPVGARPARGRPAGLLEPHTSKLGGKLGGYTVDAKGARPR